MVALHWRLFLRNCWSLIIWGICMYFVVFESPFTKCWQILAVFFIWQSQTVHCYERRLGAELERLSRGGMMQTNAKPSRKRRVSRSIWWIFLLASTHNRPAFSRMERVLGSLRCLVLCEQVSSHPVASTAVLLRRRDGFASRTSPVRSWIRTPKL